MWDLSLFYCSDCKPGFFVLPETEGKLSHALWCMCGEKCAFLSQHSCRVCGLYVPGNFDDSYRIMLQIFTNSYRIMCVVLKVLCQYLGSAYLNHFQHERLK